MKKTLDWFNFFYSLGAVIILSGVIAKLLELKGQDILMTTGLSIEIFIFAISSIKLVEKKVKNKSSLSSIRTDFENREYSKPGTYINIQGSGVDTSFEKNIPENNNSTNTNDTRLTLDLNLDENIYYDNNSSISKLDQIYALSLVEDLFYHPSLIEFEVVSYKKLSILIKRLFNLRMPNYEFLSILTNSPIKIPIPDHHKLKLVETTYLDDKEIEIITNLFLNFDNFYFFDYFVIDCHKYENILREKYAFEYQIYGGESRILLTHVEKFNPNYVISPNLDCIKHLIKKSEYNLIEKLIIDFNSDNYFEFISLCSIICDTEDNYRKLFYNKIKSVKYNFKDRNSFKAFKSLIRLSLSFQDKDLGKSLFKNKCEITENNIRSIKLIDILFFYDDYIYFGGNNEYKISISDLFSPEEVNDIVIFKNLINQLNEEKIASEEDLNDLFGINDQDYKKIIYEKLQKNDQILNGSKLAYILLFEKFYKNK